MKPLQLDFSSRKQRQRNNAGITAAAIMLLLVSGLALHHRNMLDRLAQMEARANSGNSLAVARHGMPSEAEQHEVKSAIDAQRALNLPWNELLSALERTQEQGSTKINLISVQPNPAKGEITITGEATDFTALMDYLKTLRAQPIFADVVLLNQRNVEEDERQRLEFTLSVGWRI